MSDNHQKPMLRFPQPSYSLHLLLAPHRPCFSAPERAGDLNDDRMKPLVAVQDLPQESPAGLLRERRTAPT